MSISNPNLIIGLAIGLLLGVLIVIWRRHYMDLFAGLMVAGILGLAIVVTIYQVDQYRTQKEAASRLAASQPSQPESMSGTSQPPARPPGAVPMLPPGIRGLSGAAAPPAALPPGAGNP